MKLTAQRFTLTSQLTGDILFEHLWDKQKVKSVQEQFTQNRSQVTSSLLAVLSQLGKELDNSSIKFARFQSRQVKETSNYQGQVSALHKRQKSTKRGLNYSAAVKNGPNLVLFETSVDGLYTGLYMRCGNDDMFDSNDELYKVVGQLLHDVAKEFAKTNSSYKDLPTTLSEIRTAQETEKWLNFAQDVHEAGTFEKYLTDQVQQFYHDHVVLLTIPLKKNQYGTATSQMSEVLISE